jgi:hypothetical protein
MRRAHALLIALLYLTSPNGSPIWIVASNVEAVRSPVSGECSKCAHAVVVTAGGSFAVKETPQAVAKQLENAK